MAAFLRLWNLGSIPPGLTPDEASLGYNAYSILKTGRDEYGELMPIVFKSFGDYKAGLYVYLTVPFVALLGLTEFAIRLPSAVAGVTAVWLVYKIVNELMSYGLGVRSSRYLTHNAQTQNEITALTASLILAINPWHIHYSRGAWEANVSLTLTLTGILFFLKSFKNSKFLIASSILFSLTILTYQGAKLSSFIVAVTLILTFWKESKYLIRNNFTIVVQMTVVGFILISPILLSMFQGRAGRLEVFSIFSYRRPIEQVQEMTSQSSEVIGGLSYKLYHSEDLNYFRAILGRWFNHISSRFLIFTGDWQNLRHSIPNHGLLLLADLLFLIIGFAALIKKKSKATIFIFIWLVLAPLPSALSRDQVHAVRALNMVIPLTLISSVGAFTVIKYISKLNRLRVAGYGLFFTFYLLPFTLFLDSYFVHLPNHNAKYWFYGYKEAVDEVIQILDKYDTVVFQQSYDQPYIYFLFNQKYDPVKFQKQAKLKDGGVDVGLVERLDNISFESFSWPHRTDRKNILIVGNPVGIPALINEKDFNLIKEIKYPDGFETAFRIVEVK